MGWKLLGRGGSAICTISELCFTTILICGDERKLVGLFIVFSWFPGCAVAALLYPCFMRFHSSCFLDSIFPRCSAQLSPHTACCIAQPLLKRYASKLQCSHCTSRKPQPLREIMILPNDWEGNCLQSKAHKC